ncbi:MAG: glycosyltransferase [Chloroflexi bacterium]|nr:glycosyltransferase [Chloroflexota bacterium]
MDDLYTSADALLFVSAQEGFGIPLIEAGIAGLPAFCADIPPLREIAGGDAIFFSLEASPLEIAERIAAFVRTDQRYRLRKRVLARYTWSHVFDEQLIPLLRAVAAGDTTGV